MQYDNGWYGITGIRNKRCNVHYFHKDKVIHSLNASSIEVIQGSRFFRKEHEQKRCRKCEYILHSCEKIGLDVLLNNR